MTLLSILPPMWPLQVLLPACVTMYGVYLSGSPSEEGGDYHWRWSITQACTRTAKHWRNLVLSYGQAVQLSMPLLAFRYIPFVFFFKNPSNCFMVSSENIMFICWLCDQNIPHGHGLSKCSSTVTLHFAYVWYRGVAISIIQKFNITS